MRVSFVLPTLNLAGGTRVVADYANWLATHGHHVTVAWPAPRVEPLAGRVKRALRRELALSGLWNSSAVDRTYFRTRENSIRLIECGNGRVSSADLPDGDIVVSTFWAAVEWMNDFPDRIGRKVHFIQGDDRLTPGLPLDRVLSAWRQPMSRIAVAPWLKRSISEVVGEVPVSIVLNGVDHNLFRADPRRRGPVPTIGFLHTTLYIKGCDILAQAVATARSRIPGLRVLSFGERVRHSPFLPSFVEFFPTPPQARLREIYANCDWWIWASRAEGFGLPILEAMACRTPVIATPAGAAPELLAGKAGYLVTEASAEEVAKAIVSCCAISEEKWAAYSNAAHRTAMQRSVDRAAREFERALLGVHDQTLLCASSAESVGEPVGLG